MRQASLRRLPRPPQDIGAVHSRRLLLLFLTALEVQQSVDASGPSSTDRSTARAVDPRARLT
jgi:hypothetical protein